MAYTYTDPTGGVFPDAISEVRYYLNDRSPAAPFSLTDAEIQFELAQANNNRLLAAANAATEMAIVYGTQATTQKSVGNLSLSRDYASLKGTYEGLSRRLRLRSSPTGVASGIFTGDSDDLEPQFTIGQFDNNG